MFFSCVLLSPNCLGFQAAVTLSEDRSADPGEVVVKRARSLDPSGYGKSLNQNKRWEILFKKFDIPSSGC